ncbi:FBP domain-containing protein [Arthrobacter sp. A2-55]|uniref:FBP domain-containing protein n=1 Tax=Arthrobacter sp. A2-55 TaxID=2897337 RepID=UPI0021CDBAE1|nr:FBP domain-containing protein [Arthrobacter sp. A2-55]MCU6479952.1 FBP domain-containing protein [Arthrobacter sp. A2-55]
MLSLDEKTIRSSFINASQRERSNMNLPENFDTLDWDGLDFLGWRDKKYPELGYAVAWTGGRPVGVLLRQVEGKTRSRPQCAWCEDVYLPNDVVFFNTKRAGAPGRQGNTVATLVCANFECSANVRRLPPVAYLGFDVEAARVERIAALQGNVESFLRKVGGDTP